MESREAPTILPVGAKGSSWILDGQGFSACEVPTPNSLDNCAAVPPVSVETYSPYSFSSPWPAPILGDLVIESLAHDGRQWVASIKNRGTSTLALTGHTLFVDGAPKGLTGVLTASSTQAVAIPGGLAKDAAHHLRLERSGTVLDSLSVADPRESERFFLAADGSGIRQRCAAGQGACMLPEAREAPRFLYKLRSKDDFFTLAAAGLERSAGAVAVKFAIDLEDNGRVYFMNSDRYALHYDFVHEVLQGGAPFDLCDRAQAYQHLVGRAEFSQKNYSQVVGRRFYLGTLVHYADSGFWTVEFTMGDKITSRMVKNAFFRVASAVNYGEELNLRPRTYAQVPLFRELDGELPILASDAPYKNKSIQLLNVGASFGVLKVVAPGEVAQQSFLTIAILEHAPLDVPPLAGTITESFQTPLSHLNVLAQSRGTPNMALSNARKHPDLGPLIGQWVRLDVTSAGFSVREARAEEATAYFEEKFGARPVLQPLRDTHFMQIIDLHSASMETAVRIGAKAAQFAQLMKLNFAQAQTLDCLQVGVHVSVPDKAFALPFGFFAAHMVQSGAQKLLERLLAAEAVGIGTATRDQRLKAIRDAIRAHAVDATLLKSLRVLLLTQFGLSRVRFRSSTNVEDLVGFSGAGLYKSQSAQLGAQSRKIEDALVKVWASTFGLRAYEERRLYNVEERGVAMGILIHRGFSSEEANGVLISGNLSRPQSSGNTFNSQLGEVSVVIPEIPGVVPEQILVKPFSPPEEVVLSRSNLFGGAPVLESQELRDLSCAADFVERDFSRRFPAKESFAVDIEFKVIGANRDLILKQARPYAVAETLVNRCPSDKPYERRPWELK